MIQFPTLPLYTLLFWLIINYLTPPSSLGFLTDGRRTRAMEKNLHGEKLGGLDPTRVPPYSTGIHRATGYLYYCSATATEYVVLQKVRVHSNICDSFDLTKSWIWLIRQSLDLTKVKSAQLTTQNLDCSDLTKSRVWLIRQSFDLTKVK